jgi:hypothetical protein
VVALATGAALLHAHIAASHAGKGPLRGAGQTVWAYPEGPVGTRFSDGLRELQIAGSQPVTITSVTVVGGGRALSNEGALIGLPGRPWDFNEWMKGFPPPALPPEFREPAVGAELQPGSDYMLVIGYEVRRHVADRQTAVVIDYTSDGHNYRLVVDAGIVMCPPSFTRNQCTTL